ncbi:DUF7282 domain-containing protein [Halostella litorea]|uniref:DUF7282 domain-containing protein n=1 Tax=Halostella litorea TaxID=2528831 RepID=UPI0010919809|nr:hypothetical protein [Halostella litorea]
MSRGRRAAAALLAVALVLPLVGVAAVPAGGHGNHLTARAQVSGDGSVVVEQLFLLERGYLVIHESDGGDPGAVVGHVALESGYHRDVPVEVADAWWESASDNESLVAVLHDDAEAGDEFDPETDGPLYSLGTLAADEFPVRAGDGSVNVVAMSLTGRTVDDSLTVPTARLADDGHLVVRRADDETGDPAEVVGSAPLAAGSHNNVSVPVDREALPGNDTRVSLWVTVHRDDGDGAFDLASDDPVRVGGSPVQSRVSATLGEAGDGGGLDVGVNTATPDPGTTDAAGSTTGGTTADGSGDGDTSMPAVGVVGTLAAVAAGALLAARRRAER